MKKQDIALHLINIIDLKDTYSPRRAMEKTIIITESFKALEALNYETLLSFFAQNATTDCDMYGHLKAPDFLKIFLHDTSSSKITIKSIIKDEHDPNKVTVHFELIWTTSGGQTLTSDIKKTLNFDNDNKIIHITAKYKLLGLS